MEERGHQRALMGDREVLGQSWGTLNLVLVRRVGIGVADVEHVIGEDSGRAQPLALDGDRQAAL